MPRGLVRYLRQASEDLDVSAYRIQGHASVFDVVDSRGGMFHRGAWRDSVDELRSVLMFWEHSPLVNWLSTSDWPIGRTQELREDDYGLWYSTPVAPTDYGRVALTLVAYDILRATSVSWKPEFDYYVEDEIVHRTRADLLEISLVIWPGNPLATAKVVEVGAGANAAFAVPQLDRLFLDELQAFLQEEQAAA